MLSADGTCVAFRRRAAGGPHAGALSAEGGDATVVLPKVPPTGKRGPAPPAAAREDSTEGTLYIVSAVLRN